MMQMYNQYKIRVVYKSGYYHDFWCWKFTINNQKASWSAVGYQNKPLVLGFDDISSVFQIGHRKVFRFSKPFEG